MRQFTLALATLALATVAVDGCTTTDPQGAAGIDYRLPRTDANVTLGVDVAQCESGKNIPEVKIATSLKVDVVAGAQDQLWHLSGRELASASTKRGLTVDVDDRGVISSVNATATDQQSAILGNTVKIAAAAAPFAAENQATYVLICRQDTIRALKRAKALKDVIANERATLASAANPSAVKKKIDARIAELAAVNTSLHRDIVARVRLDKNYLKTKDENGIVLTFDAKPLAELFEASAFGPDAKSADPKPVNETTEDDIEVRAYYTVNGAPSDALGGDSSDPPQECRQWMYVPSATPITFTVVPVGPLLQGEMTLADGRPAPKGDRTIKTNMVASQLGDAARLCISAAFGENRTIGLKFDKFGRTTEFAWSADARAANVTSALTGAAADTSTVITTLSGRSLADEKKELDRLTTEQSLKKARACQALLDAGAASCPSN